MAQFSRIPFYSRSGATGSRSDLYGVSTAASYAQLVHDRRVVFLKNKNTQIATPDNDLGAAICSYNEAIGEILVGLKDKLNRYSSEDLRTLTPQKLILDEVDFIRSLILKESRKLENSPAVKKAEEERKLRNLMSMRMMIRD